MKRDAQRITLLLVSHVVAGLLFGLLDLASPIFADVRWRVVGMCLTALVLLWCFAFAVYSGAVGRSWLGLGCIVLFGIAIVIAAS